MHKLPKYMKKSKSKQIDCIIVLGGDKGVRNLVPDFVKITFISNLSFTRFLSKSKDLYAEILPLIINNIFFNFF